MGSGSHEEIVEVSDALNTYLDRLCGLSFDVFTTPERFRALERLERMARRLRTPAHALINQLDAQAGEEELVARCARPCGESPASSSAPDRASHLSSTACCP